MQTLKLFIWFSFLIFLVGLSYSYPVTNNLSYEVKYRPVDSIANPTSFVGTEKTIPSGVTHDITGSNFYYSSDKSMAYFTTAPDSTGGNLVQGHYDSYRHNFPPSSFNWLTTTQCRVTLSGSTISANFDHLGVTQVQNYISFLESNARHILDNNYYMRVNLTQDLVFVDTNEVIDSSSSIIRISDKDRTLPTYYTSSEIDSIAESSGNYGEYNVLTTITPTDLKCDFNANGIVGTTEISGVSDRETLSYNVPVPPVINNFEVSPSPLVPGTSDVRLEWDAENADTCTLTGVPSYSDTLTASIINTPLTTNSATYSLTCENSLTGENDTSTLTVYLDSDDDGVHNAIDACPSIAWNETTSLNYNGCPQYTLNSCTNAGGDLSFNQENMRIACTDTVSSDVRYRGPSATAGETGDFLTTFGHGDRLNLADFDLGSGNYNCVEEVGAWWWTRDEYRGSCDVTSHGGEDTLATCFADGEPYTEGLNVLFYSHPYFLPEAFTDSEIRTCLDTGLFSGSDSYRFDSFGRLPRDYAGMRWFDHDSLLLTEDDETTTLKTRVGYENDTGTFINRDNTTDTFTIPTVDTSKKIRVFENGVNIRNDTIDPVLIALKAHKIRKHKSAEEVETFVTDTVRLMEKFSIVKNLTTTGGASPKTTVQIKLSDFAEGSITNLTIYQVIDKDVAAHYDDINFISDGGGERIVLDTDPVIGWYFNESEGDETIEYEVDGENEGGTIIITQEPILFNEGSLVINYRETAYGGCEVGEAALFEVDDLENTEVYPVGSGMYYTVCITDLEEDLYSGTSKALDMHLFTHSNGGNLSIEDLFGSESVDITLDNTTSIYWDMIIANDNPDGTYSCLGSITNEEDSTFGDCGYTNKRIWLHLGEDSIAPTTQVEVPYLAHTVDVIFNATDNTGGSGVVETQYCLSESSGCTNFTTYTGPFRETCPSDFGCTKEMRFFSTDLEGNVEEVQDYTLRIIDRGSACQSDCTARPSPNRFLKECRNLNGCEYYDVGGDDGYQTSLLCDFLTEGSHVKINSTHEVMCPNGPTRPLRFTGFDLNFNNGDCDNVISIPFPIFVEGEPVTMRVISCEK